MEDSAQTLTANGGQLAARDVGVPASDFTQSTWYLLLCRVPDLAGEVGERTAHGEPLWDIARRFGVTARQMRRWIDADAERRAEYDAGRGVVADELAMDVVRIADEQKEAVKANGEKYDPDVPRDALRVKARMWAAEKLDPMAYGRRTQVTNVNVDVGEWQERLRRAGSRVIEGTAQAVEERPGDI